MVVVGAGLTSPAAFTPARSASYHRAQMATTREALETTIALERQSMSLYARMARIFAGDPKVRDFWFGMARDEARHVGALDLVTTVLELEGTLQKPSQISLEDATIVRLREMLDRFHREAASNLKLERALEMAVEVEETELEDLVADLLKAVQAPDEYERCLRLLVHDLGELGFMIERYCHDAKLLQRCDALCDRHAESLRHNESLKAV
jgi:rubrerythrin